MVAVYSKILALVRGFLFNLFLPETGRVGRQSCSEVWHDLHRRRKYAGTGSSICICIHTHMYMSVQHPLYLAVCRFEIVAQGHAGSFRDPWQSKGWLQGCSYN